MGSPARPVVAVCVLIILAGCGGVGADLSPSGSNAPATESPTDATGGGGPTPADDTLAVHFINVEQGHAVLVVGPTGETMLVDSGHWDDDGRHVIAYLERHGVDRIDYLVTSHADADHVGGHAEVIEHFETERDGVDAVYDPGIAASTQTYLDYLDAVERHEVPLYRTLDGDSIPMAGADVDVLAPPEEYLANDDRNENSLVLRVGFGRATFLLPGDAESRAEEYLLDQHGSGLSANVLQAGHHGSSTSSGPAFLDRVDPRVAVISSAYDSPHGHPHEEVLDRLADRSVRTYWTAIHGNVVVRTDGDSMTVETQRDATIDPRSLYAEPPIEPGDPHPVQPRLTLSGVDLGTVEAASESTPATATDGGQDADLAVAEIDADAEGDDRENLNDEYVVFENVGDDEIDLSRWTVTDEANHVYRFPDGATLAPGERLTLHTGEGEDGDGDFYWGSEGPVWNNDGDTIFVHDAEGRPVLEESYT